MMETIRAWVGRSFRNRIFVAMLAATLLPLLVWPLLNRRVLLRRPMNEALIVCRP